MTNHTCTHNEYCIDDCPNRLEKIKKGAKDFDKRFLGVMKELANEEKMSKVTGTPYKVPKNAKLKNVRTFYKGKTYSAKPNKKGKVKFKDLQDEHGNLYIEVIDLLPKGMKTVSLNMGGSGYEDTNKRKYKKPKYTSNCCGCNITTEVEANMTGQRKVWGDIEFILKQSKDKDLRSMLEDYLKRNK